MNAACRVQNFRTDSTTPSPSLSGRRKRSSVTKLYGQVQQGEVDEALVTSAVGSAGVLFHFPSGQLNRMITGYIAASEGDAPPTAMLFGKPRKD